MTKQDDIGIMPEEVQGRYLAKDRPHKGMVASWTTTDRDCPINDHFPIQLERGRSSIDYHIWVGGRIEGFAIDLTKGPSPHHITR